jgi:hypothetical protein
MAPTRLFNNLHCAKLRRHQYFHSFTPWGQAPAGGQKAEGSERPFASPGETG